MPSLSEGKNTFTCRTRRKELKRISKEKINGHDFEVGFCSFCIIKYVILYICKTSVRLINDSEQLPLCKYCSVMYERLCLEMQSVEMEMEIHSWF